MKLKGMVWPPSQGAGLSQRKHMGSGWTLTVISFQLSQGTCPTGLSGPTEAPSRGLSDVPKDTPGCSLSGIAGEGALTLSSFLTDSPLPVSVLQVPGQGLSDGMDLTHLMQFFGSLSQSVLQRKRSQASQPMGGVRRSPFSSSSTWSTRASKNTGVGGQ